jgi:hypothetical protein
MSEKLIEANEYVIESLVFILDCSREFFSQMLILSDA